MRPTIETTRRLKLLFVAAALALPLALPGMALAQASPNTPTFTLPDIKVPIPGFTGVNGFTSPSIDKNPNTCAAAQFGGDGCVQIPWIGQYISGLYRFAVLASTIVAAIVIMGAGFVWLTAGGNATQIGTAKSYLSGAILGLVLMLGSYMVLNLINPELVVFQALRIPMVKRVPPATIVKQLETGPAGEQVVFNTCYDSATGLPLTQLSNTDLDPAMQSYFNEAANKFGLSPSFVASIAAVETFGQFNNKVSPTYATGVMQIVPGTANDIWDKNYTQGAVPRPDPECSGSNRPTKKNPYPPACKQWMESHQREVVLMGAGYIKNYIQPQLDRCGDFSQDLTIVAGSYNQGTGLVDPDTGEGLCDGIVPNKKAVQDYVRYANGYNAHFCAQAGGTTNPQSPTGGT